MHPALLRRRLRPRTASTPSEPPGDPTELTLTTGTLTDYAAPKTGRVGPFLMPNGALYAVGALASNSATLAVWKAPDPDAPSWTQLANTIANRNAGTAREIGAIDCVVYGTKLIIGFQQDRGRAHMAILETADDTWCVATSNDAGGYTASADQAAGTDRTQYLYAPTESADLIPAYAQMILVRRGAEFDVVTTQWATTVPAAVMRHRDAAGAWGNQVNYGTSGSYTARIAMGAIPETATRVRVFTAMTDGTNLRIASRQWNSTTKSFVRDDGTTSATVTVSSIDLPAAAGGFLANVRGSRGHLRGTTGVLLYRAAGGELYEATYTAADGAVTLAAAEVAATGPALVDNRAHVHAFDGADGADVAFWVETGTNRIRARRGTGDVLTLGTLTAGFMSATVDPTGTEWPAYVLFVDAADSAVRAGSTALP